MRGTVRMAVPLVLVACVAAAAWTFAASAQEGDATVAAALLKSGRDAIQRKSWDEAVTLFDRVLREAPDAIEAEYQKALALDRKGDRTAALASYRRFLDRLRAKTGEGRAAAAETALGPPAEKRVATLALGEQELAKLEDQFAAQLLALAKKSAARDPQLAAHALRILLAGHPDHEEAKELLAKVGGAGAAAPAAAPAAAGDGPFAKLPVKEWRDLIARRTFVAGIIQYGDPGFVIDIAESKIVHPSEHEDLGARFAYECEVRVTEEKARGWLAGLVFGLRDDDFRSVFFQRGQVVLTAGNLKTGPAGDLGQAPLKTLDLAKWHRLGVRVDGAKVEVWFDGERVLSVDDPRKDLSGDIGLFQQRSRVEWRLLRAGSVE